MEIDILTRQNEIAFFILQVAFLLLVILLAAGIILNIYDKRIVWKYRAKRTVERAKQKYLKARLTTEKLKSEINDYFEKKSDVDQNTQNDDDS